MEGKEEFSKDGILYLTLLYSLPHPPEGKAGKRIRGFIEEIFSLTKSRANSALERLSARFEADENKRKHLLHRPLLLSLCIWLGEEERSYRLEASFCLSRCGRMLRETKKAARFDKKSGRFLYEIHEKKRKKKS